jgi:hypothetical protein
LTLLAIFAYLAAIAVSRSDSCRASSLIPAYAHNDYRNRRPLLDALEAGYRGVEADVIRDGKSLVVAHDRRDVRRTRTLSRLYLQPLVERTRSCGHLLPDSTSFHLYIDLKEADREAFRLLVAELRDFEELFLAPGSGASAPIRVTLVGWAPRSTADVASWPRYLRIHLPVARISDFPPHVDSSRIGLVSIDYGKALRWDGRGPFPQRAVELLAEARRVAGTLGVPLRVHHAPARRNIVEWLRTEGVSLIGADDLGSVRSLLVEVSKQP